jgi:hypothetical protein
MIVVLDATLLLPLIKASGPKGLSVKFNHLLDTLDQRGDRVIVPAPAYSEVLVKAPGEIAAIFQKIEDAKRFQIEPFGKRAAIECAELIAKAWGTGGKKNFNSPWAKVKFDHQIVAIAKLCGADVVYSDDGDVKSLCARENIKCLGTEDMPVPPAKAQSELPLDDRPTA